MVIMTNKKIYFNPTKNKKNIYLPIETKQREYLSNLLIAQKAATKGFRTFIGTKEAIFDLILNKKERKGIFLYKGGLESNLFEKISKKVQYNFILDHEMTPGQNMSLYNKEVSGNFFEEPCPVNSDAARVHSVSNPGWTPVPYGFAQNHGLP